VLHVQYGGRLQLNLLDLYRLGAGADLASLGCLDLLGFDAGVAAVEWAEYLGAALPPERLELHLSLCGETARGLHIAAHGPQHLDLARRWQEEIAP